MHMQLWTVQCWLSPPADGATCVLARQRLTVLQPPREEEATQLGETWFGGAAYVNHTTRPIDMAQWKRYRKDRPLIERTTRLARSEPSKHRGTWGGVEYATRGWRSAGR